MIYEYKGESYRQDFFRLYNEIKRMSEKHDVYIEGIFEDFYNTHLRDI